MPRANPLGLSISLTNTVTPFLQHLAKKHPGAVKVALRRTAGHFRKQLKAEIGVIYGTTPKKKMLRPDVHKDLMERHKNGYKSAYRHAHETKNPWTSSTTSHRLYTGSRKVPPLKFSPRYNPASSDGMSWVFGFTGQKYDRRYAPIKNSVSDSAQLFAKALQEGKFIDPKSRRLTNTLSPAMKRRLGVAGIGVTKGKDRIDMPKRPVIDPFFAKNRGNMLKYMRDVFTQEVEKRERVATKVAKRSAIKRRFTA